MENLLTRVLDNAPKSFQENIIKAWNGRAESERNNFIRREFNPPEKETSKYISLPFDKLPEKVQKAVISRCWTLELSNCRHFGDVTCPTCKGGGGKMVKSSNPYWIAMNGPYCWQSCNKCQGSGAIDYVVHTKLKSLKN